MQCSDRLCRINPAFDLIKEGSWTGKTNVSYSDLNEAGSYWFFHTLDSPKLKASVREVLGHALDTQWDDGCFGRETNDQWQPRWSCEEGVNSSSERLGWPKQNLSLRI
ncbi:hypothetical protein V565_107580, partial [Rhizoctonia solani 123E]